MWKCEGRPVSEILWWRCKAVVIVWWQRLEFNWSRTIHVVLGHRWWVTGREGGSAGCGARSSRGRGRSIGCRRRWLITHRTVPYTRERLRSRAVASIRVLYSSNFYYSSTRYFRFPVANFHFRLQFFAVNLWIVRLYGNLGLHDFIWNLPAWK